MRVEIKGLGIPGGVNILPVPNPPVIPQGAIVAAGGSFPTFSFLVPKGSQREIRVSGIFDNVCMSGGTAGYKNLFVGQARKNGNIAFDVQETMSVDLELSTSMTHPIKLKIGAPSGYSPSLTDLRIAKFGGTVSSCSSVTIQDFRHGLNYSLPIEEGSPSQVHVYPLMVHARYTINYDCGGAATAELRMGPGDANGVQGFTCAGSTCTCSTPANGCLPL
jgi:hypothetical protein